MKPTQTKIRNGLSFAVGRTPGAALPVDLILQYGEQKFNTHWSCDDAEGIACSLLKHVEILRRQKAEEEKNGKQLSIQGS